MLMPGNYKKSIPPPLGLAGELKHVAKDKKIHSTLPEMDDEQYVMWTDLLEERTGMRLPDTRKSFLVTNLGMRMHSLGFTGFQEYYDHIQSGLNGTVEWDRLVHHLTVHETRFLRHQSTLHLIRDHCLPQEPATSETARKPVTLNVWSVGCSSGEEPYSIAMTVDDHLVSLGYDCYLGIMASDISRSALAHGRKGVYSDRQISKINEEWLARYFNQTKNNKYQLTVELRQRVCFNHLNILDMGRVPIGNMDVIVCQNVLIYYDRERRLEIVNNLVNYLAPGGLIIFAVGEMLNWEHDEMTRFHYPNTLAYRRNK